MWAILLFAFQHPLLLGVMWFAAGISVVLLLRNIWV